MKYLLFTLFALNLVILSSCKEDEEVGTVVINFKAVYDGEPLHTFDTKAFENGQRLQFTLLTMMVSDLELLKSGGVESLDDIELVNLSFADSPSAAAGYTLTIHDVPAQTYTGLSLGIGVPEDLNAMVPADFPSNNPLSNTGYYWTGWGSYIFQKTEGTLDTIGNGPLDLGFSLHTGSDPLYSVLQGSPTLVVEDGKTLELDIVVDYKLLLAGVDIKSNPQNHNPQDIATIQAIVDNLPNALVLIQ